MRGEVKKVQGFSRFPHMAVEHIMRRVLDADLSALFKSSR